MPINYQDLDRVLLRSHYLLIHIVQFNMKVQCVWKETLSRNPLVGLFGTSATMEGVKAYISAAEMVRPASTKKIQQIKHVTSSHYLLRGIHMYLGIAGQSS